MNAREIIIARIDRFSYRPNSHLSGNANDNAIIAIGRPWSAGDFTYATNQHLLVRVPRIGLNEFPENPCAPKGEAIRRPDGSIVSHKELFQNEFYRAAGFTNSITLEPHGLKKEECEDCKGSGVQPGIMQCPQCEGDGTVPLSVDDDEYEKCVKCNGKGKVDDPVNTEPCSHCEGEKVRYREHVFIGDVKEDESEAWTKIRGGGDFFAARYLDLLLNNLPGSIRIVVPGNERPAYFVFDGGDGFIMPIRIEATITKSIKA